MPAAVTSHPETARPLAELAGVVALSFAPGVLVLVEAGVELEEAGLGGKAAFSLNTVADWAAVGFTARTAP
jgi:hypothetical protein